MQRHISIDRIFYTFIFIIYPLVGCLADNILHGEGSLNSGEHINAVNTPKDLGTHLEALGAIINRIRTILNKYTPGVRIHVSNGTAIAVLDRSLDLNQINDIDLYVVEPSINEITLGRIIKDINDKSIGLGEVVGGPRKVRRVNPDGSQTEPFQVGWQLWILVPTEDGTNTLPVDLNIYPNPDNVRFNGFFGIDHMALPINPDESPVDALRNITTESYDNLIGKKALIDLYESYQGWTNKSLNHLNLTAFKAYPETAIVRMVYTYYEKLKVEVIPQEHMNLMRQIVATHGGVQQVFAVDMLLKKTFMSGGETTAKQLKALAAIGMLKVLSPTLQNYVLKANIYSLILLLDQSREVEVRGLSNQRLQALKRFLNLITVVSNREAIQILGWAKEHPSRHPETVADLDTLIKRLEP